MSEVCPRSCRAARTVHSGRERPGADGRRPTPEGRWLLACVVGSLSATLSSAAAATPNPWPFDFDVQLADDPATVQSMIDELGAGLPGLRDEEMVGSQHGPVSLWFFESLLDALERARTAGPDPMPPVARNAILCAEHASFVYPALLANGASSACGLVEDGIAAAFENNRAACLQVEFPETYVFEHAPGHVDFSVVSSWEGLIAVAGEALSHIDYPASLLPDDFFTTLRPIIAKLRYSQLGAQLDEQAASYAVALQQLDASASCFDPVARSGFEATVAELTAELEQARVHLDQIHADGLAQAAVDRASMEAQCRARPELPYPALTDEERILLSFYVGGIYWRARGAGLLGEPPDPEMGTLRRLWYVKYPFQLIGDLTGGADADAVGDRILFDENWGWDEWWDMGTTPGSQDEYYDLVGMTNRGKRGTDTARSLIEARGYDIRSLVAGGMQMGPCYYYAWDHLADFRLGEDLQWPYMWFIEWPTSIGEFCAGAALAEGLARTMLWGRPIEPCEPDPCADGSCGGGGSGAAAGGAAGCGPCPQGSQCDEDGQCVPAGSAGGAGATAAGASADDDAQGCGCSSPGAAGSLRGGLGLVLATLLVRGARRRRTNPFQRGSRAPRRHAASARHRVPR